MFYVLLKILSQKDTTTRNQTFNKSIITQYNKEILSLMIKQLKLPKNTNVITTRTLIDFFIMENTAIYLNNIDDVT